MISIRIQSEGVRNSLARLRVLATKPRSLVMAGAQALRIALRGHFVGRDKEGNALGGKRTHFWSDVAKSVQIPADQVTDRSARVQIGEARFAQKYFGGQIVAKGAEYLTIPIDPRAHGRRASVVAQQLGVRLFRVTAKSGKMFLGAKVGKRQRFSLFYVLKKSVEQEADPRALPPQEQMDQAVQAAVEAELAEQVMEAQGA
jgi:hypothetical protein